MISLAFYVIDGINFIEKLGFSKNVQDNFKREGIVLYFCSFVFVDVV